MKRFNTRQLLYCAGNVLGSIGFLVILGSVAALVAGPEEMAALYERTRPVIPFFLAGLGLMMLGVLLTIGRQPDATASGGAAASDGRIRCRKCAGLNDVQAKFCNQCGKAF